MIKVINLSKQFEDFVIFKNVNFHIKKGECVALIGPSGAGKSMLLRTISMLEKPDSGNIYINGTNITQKGAAINKVREKMGMVYQGFHLFSHLNVLDNITLAPRLVKKINRNVAEQKAMELLSMVGLTDKADSYPHQLSGGQQQRIAIARCLAMEPEIMLFDEPTSALDPTMTREVLSIMRKLTKMGLTVLIVTHEMKFAQEVSNRVFFMADGGIYEEGTPAEIFDNPQKEKTKAFIRRLNVFSYEIHSIGFDLVAMNALIEIFCQKYNVEAKKVYHIQLLLEELIFGIIGKCYPAVPPDMAYTIACSADTDEIKITMTYNADEFNPFGQASDDDDGLGMLLVTGISKESNHTFENGLNKIDLKF
jgi:polar amino acid transport system ATP-binding protein